MYCVGICIVYMHVCACVCAFISVWPFKRFLRGEGEEKITGADIICFCHVGLASGLTHCGPVRHGRQVDVPAHMLQHEACTYPTHTDTHIWCVGATCMHTEPDMHMLTLFAQKKPHTYAFSHPHGCTLSTDTHPLFLKEVSYWGRTGRDFNIPGYIFFQTKYW